MKKLVIINFDDMFINVTKIICKLLNSLQAVKEKNILIQEEDIGCDLEKPFPSLFYSVLEDFDIQINIDEINKLEKKFENILIKESILSNGLQTFLKECQKKSIEVRVITNKPYDAVKKCIEYYTFDMVNGVDFYKEGPQAIKLIERIIEERNLTFSDTLIISNTDFNDEYLEIYEYSKDYCAKNIFSDYEEILNLLEDEEIELPLLSVSFDIEVKNEYFNEVHLLVKDVVLEIEILDTNNESKVLIINNIESRCSQEDENSMYLENMIENCISSFYLKEELLKKIKEQYKVEYYLNCVVYVESSKVNPCISPNKKIIEFLAKNDIQLNYDLYC